MKHLATLLLALSLSISSGRFHWTVTDDTLVTNFVIECLQGSNKHGWDLTKAAQFTVPLYAGDMRSFPTMHVTLQMPGSYSCTLRTYDGAPALGGRVLEVSNTVTLNQQ